MEELGQRMSAQEFAQWQSMYEKEAWNPESQRLQHASVLAAVFQGASTRKDHQPWSAAHFLGADPWAPQAVEAPKPTRRMSIAQQARAMNATRRGRR